MPLTATMQDQTCTISLFGELDHHEAKALLGEIGPILDEHLPRAVILNLQGLKFMDSSGIAVVVQANLRAKDIGASLEVWGATPQIMRIFRAAGLDKLVHFKENKGDIHNEKK